MQTADEIPHCYYHGHVEGDPASFVAVNTCHGLSGTIAAFDDHFTIESAERHLHDSEQHRIVSQSVAKRLGKAQAVRGGDRVQGTKHIVYRTAALNEKHGVCGHARAEHKHHDHAAEHMPEHVSIFSNWGGRVPPHRSWHAAELLHKQQSPATYDSTSLFVDGHPDGLDGYLAPGVNNLLRKQSRQPNDANSRHHMSVQTVTATKYVELLIVNDMARSTLIAAQTSLTPEESSLAIANLADGYYKDSPKLTESPYTIAIRVVLVAQLTFTDVNPDPWTPALVGGGNTDVQVNSLLETFRSWESNAASASQQPGFEHDNAQLITGREVDGDVVGLAQLSALCTASSSGYAQCVNGHVSPNVPYSDAFVSQTLAHELGHNLGMRHDDEDDQFNPVLPECTAVNYIMSSTSSSQSPPNRFSRCSALKFNSFLTNSKPKCMDNVPTRRYNTTATCGNGFLEPGEACDCGSNTNCTAASLPANRRDPCCNATTCQLNAAASCSSQQECCNATTCQAVTNRSLVCREATGACDIAETCNGVSATCPRDVVQSPGTTCTPDEAADSEAGTCYLGQCKSMSDQCARIGAASGSYRACTLAAPSCSQLLCSEVGSSSCVVFSLRTGSTTVPVLVEDGVQCDTGKQCLAGTCRASSELGAQDLVYVYGEWSNCYSCDQPQYRTAKCLETRVNGTEVAIGACPGLPVLQRECHNETIGCPPPAQTFLDWVIEHKNEIGVAGVCIVIIAVVYKCMHRNDGADEDDDDHRLARSVSLELKPKRRLSSRMLGRGDDDRLAIKLPPNWDIRWAPGGHPLYYNRVTGERYDFRPNH
eukprot:TRINITY_DN63741_c0_g2_i2.p1 TRINITY_DN63741_c0_g2~~TRINITY_DN63741_c0_g2_i2.p1  ORF type:complete len:961 (+),score=417.64 TRINITY_DN63741_c0_g2_i2:424-2883(+)